MGDGKALQAGTSHNLGQHFATGYEHRVPGARQVGAVRLDHVVGRLHAHDRRR